MNNETLYPADTGVRIRAAFIDGVSYILLVVPFFFLFPFYQKEGMVTYPWALLLSAALTAFAFKVACLKMWSASLGKLYLGLVVVKHSTHEKLSWRESFLRPLANLFLASFSIAPEAFALLQKDRRQLADLMAGTQVMQRKSRKRPVSVRWAWGILLVAFFGATGLFGTIQSARTNVYSAAGISQPIAERK
jgi:uncharacterized RDD family membrane protein YckC